MRPRKRLAVSGFVLQIGSSTFITRAASMVRTSEVRVLCEKFTPDAIATLAEIMGNKKAQPSARVAAAMGILKKTLPDLASIEHTGDGPRPFAVIPEGIETAAEWEAKFKPKATEH
jgi:hypothetical protein